MSENQAQSRGHGALLRGAIFFVIVCAAISLYYYSQSSSVSSTEQSNRDVGQAVNFALQGNFSDAVAQAQKVLNQVSESEPSYSGAEAVIETVKLWEGSDEEKLDAVRSMKARYARLQGDPLGQAGVIDSLLRVVTMGDQALIAEIFTGEPFSSFVQEDNMRAAVKNLAEHSLTLAPTSPAYFALAAWHSNQLLSADISESEKDEHVEAIWNVLSETKALFESELQASKDLVFGELYAPSFFYAQGMLYGTLALLDEQHLADAADSFEQVIVHYAHNRDSGLLLLEARVPYAYFMRAVFTHKVGGAANVDQVRSDLDRMIAVIEANPALHEKFFMNNLAFAVVADRTPSGIVNSSVVAELEGVSPAFSTFLNVNGL